MFYNTIHYTHEEKNVRLKLWERCSFYLISDVLTMRHLPDDETAFAQTVLTDSVPCGRSKMVRSSPQLFFGCFSKSPSTFCRYRVRSEQKPFDLNKSRFQIKSTTDNRWIDGRPSGRGSPSSPPRHEQGGGRSLGALANRVMR